MKVSVFAPPIPNIPHKYRKLRFLNQFFDMLMDFGEEKANLSLQIPDKSVPLRELAIALKFGHVLAHKQSTIQIKIGGSVFYTLDLPDLETTSLDGVYYTNSLKRLPWRSLSIVQTLA